MHDEMIERRLRAVLGEEAASISFTITAAELERRMTLRRRSVAGRRLALLLAAAVGVGLVGVGGALTGLFDQRVPTPTPGPSSPVAVIESEAPVPSGPAALPTLDELIAVDPASVVVAEGHGPTSAWGPPVEGQPPSSVNLGTLDADWSEYLVSVACLHSTALRFDVRDPHSPSGPAKGPVMPCDGTVHQAEVRAIGQDLRFTADGGASWRIVVRGPTQRPSGPVDPEQTLTADQGEDELVRFSDVISDEALPWGDGGLVIQNVGGLLTRESYTAQVRCSAGDSVRLLYGNDWEEGRVVGDETQLACDGGVHVIRQAILEPYGGQVYVVGRPGSRLDLLVSGRTPPIELVRSLPGWTISSGSGPNFSYDGSGSGWSGPGAEGGGSILVAMVCTGTTPIEVTVEVGPKVGDRQETFTAECSPEGQLTSQTFQVAGGYLEVVYTEAPLAWTALSILIPDDEP